MSLQNGSFDASLGSSLALYTDFYELTMAYGYWKYNRHNELATFYLYFRKSPFEGEYVVMAGHQTLLAYLRVYRFEQAALDFLAEQRNRVGMPVFEEGFLRYLENMELNCDIIAAPEGRLVFPHAPLLRITGPIVQCLLLEGPLLNILGFQSLVATKASRMCTAAKTDPVMEFGLRRAQGLQAAVWASRASYIGGVQSTSNVAAGQQYGISLSGTHAHSWVLSFKTEEEAFARYAELMPIDCVLLVDTYDSFKGIAKAVAIGKQMAEKGQQLHALRIDSGDLAYLSQQARTALDAAGLHQVKIIASGDINEHIISSLKQQHAPISAWGVGTHLSTAFAQATLGAVYKMSALKEGTQWTGKMKVSSSLEKANIPGRLQLRRFSSNGRLVADMIYDQDEKITSPYTIISPQDPVKKRKLDVSQLEVEELLQPLRGAPPVGQHAALQAARARCQKELNQLHPSIQRLTHPHTYPVGLESTLYHRRLQMMEQLLERGSTT